MLVRIVDGVLKKGMKIRMMGTGAAYDVDKVGVFTPKLPRLAEPRPRRDRLPHRLDQGSRRHPRRRHHHRRPPAGGERAARLQARRSRWCSAASSRSTPPTSRICATAIGKLRLNDAAFTYETETSAALGFGFRCGFLGLLHLEIIQERLTREFDLDLIATAPSVVYRIRLTNGEELELHNPADMPDPVKIAEIAEPWLTRDDPHAGRVSRLDPEALPGAARRPGRPVLCRQPRHG